MGLRYKAGLAFILIVIILWVTSSEVTQEIFKEYEHPFAIAYLGTSLLVLYIPIAFITNGLCKFFGFNSNRSSDQEEDDKSNSSSVLDSPVKAIEIMLEPIVSKPTEYPSEPESLEEGTVALASEPIGGSGLIIIEKTRELTTKEIARLALLLAPLWFTTEYLNNAALARTSVASTTVLTATSALFTLFFSAILKQDTVTLVKAISVFVSMAGVALTTLGKTWSKDKSHLSKFEGKTSVSGDLFALMSAITYALFTVLLKKTTGEKGEKVDMQKLYGYIGFITLFALWWLIWPLSAMGIEVKFKFPHTAKVEGLLFANCFVNSFVCDYFWALGVVWTTPLVAALGVSLTIPLAMVADMVIHGQRYSAVYIVGATLVFMGFVMASFSDWLWQKLKLYPRLCF
ncbi:thiamine-repressible mitochondrial transport protein THI74-like [Impatiens glandulifera]|uniref:thiamine-repressible mitochondrial transport protein THI74-like n=1 Tax=Impatiens glandulifera TaxID=253017 RepID=UPI001FB095B2|nr:thiamine-repressible mitochondrial transport protein THI74-like [Impatiens glandulifera]